MPVITALFRLFFVSFILVFTATLGDCVRPECDARAVHPPGMRYPWESPTITATPTATPEPSPFGVVVFVAQDGNGANGQTWATAYRSIGQALENVTGNTAIWVKAGTYHEAISLPAGMDLFGGFTGTETVETFSLRNLAAIQTIIDASGLSQTVVDMATGTELSGFTITGGYGTNKGGGVNCQGPAHIADCTITNNQARNGGGVACFGNGLTVVERCLIANNQTVDFSYQYDYDGSGGGVFAAHNYGLEFASIIVAYCTVTDNVAITGSGLYLGMPSAIYGCVITGNKCLPASLYADDFFNRFSGSGTINLKGGPSIVKACKILWNEARRGGGLFVGASDVELVDCTISENSALKVTRGGYYQDQPGCGGGIYCNDVDYWYSCGLRLYNCVLARNCALGISGERGAGLGGGIFVDKYYPGVQLVNCTLFGNEASYGSSALVYGEHGGLTIINSILWDQAAAPFQDLSFTDSISNYYPMDFYLIPSSSLYGDLITCSTSCIRGGWNGAGVNNFSAWPKFTSLGFNDFCLAPGSPCIDRGDASALPAEIVEDISGVLRLAGDTIDIGAHEAVAGTPSGPTDLVHNVFVCLGGRGQQSGVNWDNALANLSDALLMAGSGSNIFVAKGRYHEALVLIPGVKLYGGFSGEDLRESLDTRNFVHNETIIDASGYGRSVIIGASDTVVDGFTITGGSSFSGGGVYYENVAPFRLANCRVIDNTATDEIRRRFYHFSMNEVALFADYCGGGVYVSASTGELYNCNISNNRIYSLRNLLYASAFDKNNGGGVCSLYSTLKITKCRIVKNRLEFRTEDDWGRGLGIYVEASTFEAVCCDISDNTIISGIKANVNPYSQSFNKCGSGVFICPNNMRCYFKMVNCLVCRNDCGGVNIDTAGDLINCTMFDNRPNPLVYPTSGLMPSEIIYYQATSNIVNCIIWDRSDIEFHGRINIKNCCIRGKVLGGDYFSAWPEFMNFPNHDYRLANGSPCIDRGDASWLPESIHEDFAGNPRIQGGGVDIGAFEAPTGFVNGATDDPQPMHLYVKPNRKRDANGLTWETAFSRVSDAMVRSVSGSMVWVAQGHYPGRVWMREGVSLYGGFAGYEAPSQVYQRDWEHNETILDGAGLEQTLVMADENLVDGFTITGASDGVHIASIQLIFFPYRPYLTTGYRLANCWITGNLWNGITAFGDLEVDSCCIDHNGGRGITCKNSKKLSIKNSVISDNQGGGIYCNAENAVFQSCRIQNNLIYSDIQQCTCDFGWCPYTNCCQYESYCRSVRGPGVWLKDSKAEFENCVFFGNKAGSVEGRGFSSTHKTPREYPALAINETDYKGGGLLASHSNATLKYCTFAGNQASHGVGGYCEENSVTQLFSCVVWDGTSSLAAEATSTVSVACSDIAGGYLGEGNINADPLFTDLSNGDLTLRPSSPGIDTGSLTGPDCDLVGGFRPVDAPNQGRDGTGNEYDMGAYEYPFGRTPTATPAPTAPPTPTPWGGYTPTPTPSVCHGDINTDGWLNAWDWFVLAQYWQQLTQPVALPEHAPGAPINSADLIWLMREYRYEGRMK